MNTYLPMNTYLIDNFSVGDLVCMKYAGRELMGHVTEVGSIIRMAFDYDSGRPGLWCTWQTACGAEREMKEGILWIVARATRG